ncbi:MAG: hypothetical protein WEB58_09600 [Planctomycetaceae bacterium]
MTRRQWLWSALLALPLAVAGVVYANNMQAESYTCPLTGEELACKKCCPLNQSKPQAEEQSYVCPVTGEELTCKKCCPLNQSK